MEGRGGKGDFESRRSTPGWEDCHMQVGDGDHRDDHHDGDGDDHRGDDHDDGDGHHRDGSVGASF